MMWLVENMFFIESGMILDILFNFYGYLFRMIIGKFVLLVYKFWLNNNC